MNQSQWPAPVPIGISRPVQTSNPAGKPDLTGPARVAVDADTTALCAAQLAHVAGTHALLLGAWETGVPALPGVARWTTLRASPSGGWGGALRADAAAWPFAADAFCAIWVRAREVVAAPESIAGELARVLAPRGVLLVTGLHPWSLWPRAQVACAPARWEHSLRKAGLRVTPALRCGAPWPRVHGAAGLPRWLVRSVGGAYVIVARRSAATAIPLRSVASQRRAVEASALLPGARRECA